MNFVFLGMIFSLIYGVTVATHLYFSEGPHNFTSFLVLFSFEYRTVISLGLTAGTAIVVHQTQTLVPTKIQGSFKKSHLEATDYYENRDKFFSQKRSLVFSASFIIASFLIFSGCGFPASASVERWMIIAVCGEYAFGVYVGRKLCYAGLMVHSLIEVKVTRNIFKKGELDDINSYINTISALTMIFVYVHVKNYYGHELFLYDGLMGKSLETLLAMPAIIATPVILIFNFYPRIVLNEIYNKSVEIEIKNLKRRLKRVTLTSYEEMIYITEFNKLHRDELRHRLKLTLNDLPIAITVLIMIIIPLLGK